MITHPQQTVLITGATRELGLALTRQCLARGDRVFGGYRATSNLEDLHMLEDQ